MTTSENQFTLGFAPCLSRIFEAFNYGFMIARLVGPLHFHIAVQMLDLALMAPIAALVSTLSFPLARHCTFLLNVTSWVILCPHIGMAHGFTGVTALHPDRAFKNATSFCHLCKVFHFLDGRYIIMIDTLELETVSELASALQMFDNVFPQFESGSHHTLSISENVESLAGSRKGDTDSVGDLQETNLVLWI